MHTIGKDGDGTWWVARQEIEPAGSGSQTVLSPMFVKLSFNSALRLCNYLNGGSAILDNLIPLEQCAV